MKKIKKFIRSLKIFDIILILSAAAGVLFSSYYFFRKPNYVTVVIKIYEDSPVWASWKETMGTTAWFEQNFYEGMKETDGFGKTVAEVESVYSYDKDHRTKAVYLTTRLSSVWNRATNQNTYKGKPLIVGSTIKVNFDRVYVEGLITHVEGFPDKRERVELNLETKVFEYNPVYEGSEGVRKELADAIKVGDEVMDSLGNVVLKVTAKNVNDAKKIVVTSDGKVVQTTSPDRADVILKITVNAYKLNGKYYLFDDIPILIGQKLPVNTTYYTILPEVTKISEE